MDDFLNSKYFLKELNKIEYNDKIVFCDIDGTIYRNSLFLDLLELLMEDGYISQNKIKIYGQNKRKWKNREIGYDEFIMYAVINIFEKMIKTQKLHSSELLKYTKHILKTNGKHILTYTMDKLNKLKNNGYKVVFISGSPNVMVKEFAKLYNFDIGFGTILEKGKDGYLNGNRTVLASSDSKVQIMSAIIDKINPKHTISLGDTNGDYGMLLSTDLGIAINPSEELYSLIKYKESVNVIIERKDLILDLDVSARKFIKSL